MGWDLKEYITIHQRSYGHHVVVHKNCHRNDPYEQFEQLLVVNKMKAELKMWSTFLLVVFSSISEILFKVPKIPN